jgi:hypothetical protein
MAEFQPIPYRIRIGVTGHRKLDHPAQVQSAVQAALESEIDNLYPEKSRHHLERVRRAGTTPVSFRVLSPLAEGADRVVARAVLAQPLARLDVVLPLVIEDYLDDFATDQSRQEFRELLAHARKPVSLRTRRIQDDRSIPREQADLRREAYANVGQYVVDHCDVLIAVWDGEPSRGHGGTAEIVKYAQEQNRPIIRVWGDKFEVLNRDNNGLDASALDAIDQFNRQSIQPEQRNILTRAMDQDHFETPESAKVIPANVREFVNRLLFPFYAQASIVAKESQNQFYRAGKYIYVLSASAVACAAFGVLFRSIASIAFSAEFVILIFMWQTLRQARRKHAHPNWIEYRFLAERIRCGIFMAICGVEPKPIEVLPYMGHSQTVNDWTVRVFDEIWDRLPPLTRCRQEECPILNAYVREAWIDDQVKFHNHKKEREGQARERLARAGAIVLPVTIAASVLHLFTALWNPAAATSHWIALLHESLDQGFAFIALLFPAIAASLAGMEAQREHLRLEKRSANMAPQLEQLNRQMASATDPERFESLLQQADEIMLRETQDWLMLMRYVEIKAS